MDLGAIDQQEADNEQEFSSKDAVIPDAEGQDSNDDESEDEDENLDESQDDENPEDLANANEDTSVSQVKGLFGISILQSNSMNWVEIFPFI